jgi:hypothetical protein
MTISQPHPNRWDRVRPWLIWAMIVIGMLILAVDIGYAVREAFG